MASNLTPQQQEAVLHDGHLLIVAGPGSGKTSTSVAKATRILQDPKRSLVMVTFTKEAAEEMRRRLVKAITDAGMRAPSEERLVVATFHSIAIRHLKRHGLSTRVLSPAAQGTLYRDAVLAAGVDKNEWGEVQKEFEKVMYSVDQQKVEVKSITMKVVARYRQVLKATGQIDLYTVMRDCALRVHDGGMPPLHFTDMLVDEGQDTDELQRLWIFAHARAGCRVTIVGDDDQSIYEWRNALGFEGMRSFWIRSGPIASSWATTSDAAQRFWVRRLSLSATTSSVWASGLSPAAAAAGRSARSVPPTATSKTSCWPT